MDYESSDDEEVLDICRQLKIRVPPKKKKISFYNDENLDITNLPVIIDNNEINNSGILDHSYIQVMEELLPTSVTELTAPVSTVFPCASNDVAECISISNDIPIAETFVSNDDVTLVSLSSSSEILPQPAQPTSGNILSMENNIISNEAEAVASPSQVSDQIEEHGDLNAERKRCSKGTSKKKKWTKHTSKTLRMEGNEYLGYRRDSKEKKFKVLHDTMRPARVMGPRCNSEFCKKSKLRACDSLTDEERNTLFLNYWKKMTWDQRKQYVVSHVELCPKKQVKSEEHSRRSESKRYFLTTSNGRVQVCMNSFLSTFGIKEWTVRYWLSLSDTGMSKKPELTHKVLEGHSKKEDIAFVKDFFNSLPKMPSHYCRANTTRQYLEPIIENKNALYKLYYKKCSEENKQAVSRWSFDKIFAEQNLSLFQPKKDQCDTCCAFKAGNIRDEDYHRHVTRKQAARDEKGKDKIRALNGEVHVFTHDLQSVKLCPKLEASALYYKTKLCVHNFTMFNLSTKDVYCYWFDEHNAGLVASVFVSCIIDCLKKTLDVKAIPIILYSDGCTAQNRNVILSNALLELAIEYNVVITQKILEKGHTQMECDSSHSAIECKIKNKEIYLPSQYATISKEARPKQPFIVNFLSYDFFYDYTDKKSFYYESIRPGRVANDPTVTDLRALEYNPNGIIKYKLNFEDEYKELPRRYKFNGIRQGSRPKLYNGHLKINESKWKHLQELKTVIPADCHSFYDTLLH